VEAPFTAVGAADVGEANRAGTDLVRKLKGRERGRRVDVGGETILDGDDLWLPGGTGDEGAGGEGGHRRRGEEEERPVLVLADDGEERFGGESDPPE
jgi:hypothetical protein